LHTQIFEPIDGNYIYEINHYLIITNHMNLFMLWGAWKE
jgi:hypothetical protein